MGTLRNWKKVGVEGRLGKKMMEVPVKVAKKILGHWRIGESEPCKASEENEE